MELNKDQIAQFQKDGYLILHEVIPKTLNEDINNEIKEISNLDGKEFFREKSNDVRTIFSPEKFSEKIKELITSIYLVEPLRILFGESFYLFQSKFNNKKSLKSGSWTWHQDFKFWKEDGMPEPKAITAAIYLSDVTPFSGPILCIPGSHEIGEISTQLNNPDGVHDEDLKYIISNDTLRDVTAQCGKIKTTTAKAGSILFFHSNLLHGSSQNMHHEDREILMFTYNPLSNKTLDVDDPREEYMVKKDFQRIA